MSRPSRFTRSMTPSSSAKMSASRFNIVCGKTRELACTPNISRIPNPQPPKVIDARVTTPTMSRREFCGARERERSVSRDYRTAPAVPRRDASLYLPFGSYADLGCHTKPPSRYRSSSVAPSSSSHTYHQRSSVVVPSSGYNNHRRSSVVGPSSGGYTQSRRQSFTSSSIPYVSSTGGTGSSSFASYTHSAQSSSFARQRQNSFSYGTPAAARGIPFY